MIGGDRNCIYEEKVKVLDFPLCSFGIMILDLYKFITYSKVKSNLYI